MKRLPKSQKQAAALATVLSVVGSAAHAQQAADTLNARQLHEVVVTATRSETERSKVPQQLEVITSKEIRQTQALEFTDILKKNASVDVVQYPGLLSGVGIRGFRPQNGTLNPRTLLLVDGRPAGTTNLATLDPSSIERVEVLKGPASALYGSQAMGGVVNVITRQSRGPVRTSLFAEYASFQTFKAGGSTGGNITDKLDFDLGFSFFDRAEDYKLGKKGVFRGWLDGDKATRIYPDSTAQINDRYGDGIRRQHTKLNYYSSALRLGYQVSEHWHVDVRGERFVARRAESPNDYISYGDSSPSDADITRQNLDLSTTGNYEHHQLFVRGYSSGEFNAYIELPSTGRAYRSSQTNNYWKGLQVKDVIKLGSQQITVGIDHNKASSRPSRYAPTGTKLAAYSPSYSLTTTGIYAQGQLSLLNEKLILTPGVRYDFITYNGTQADSLYAYEAGTSIDFEAGKQTNPFFTPSLGGQYKVLESLRVHGTLGRAYVMPDAYNVAGYSRTVNYAKREASIVQGNPDLKNENSVTWDAGVGFDKPETGITADVTYFATRVKDRIVLRPTIVAGVITPEGYTVLTSSTYANANNSQIRGLEAGLGYDFGALNSYRHSLRVFANGTRIFKAQDIVNNTDGSETRTPIYNVARFNANFGVSYDNFKWLRAQLSSRYVGHRKDLDFTTYPSPLIEYPEYMTLDFSVTGTYARRHSFTLYVNNLTNENYYEKRGYNLPGRNVAVRYTVSF
ncbi:TonB-dependent receptor plug domain-containing protein [Hymenobacter cavernae]|uniref:TonB-dependent receptor n=1 Tax=Hymenobacter cavernae TaxID=2044852 RepID=A0ABQ1TS86_9BACT|nr:TonB-dependent receptor [Hymenobacter cavernae]GGF00028.1 TonB-dependent receptor [Hymenobacter cavernae]